MYRRWFLLLLCLFSLIGASEAAQAGTQTFGPQAPANPYAGPTGTDSMHGDSAQSDTTPLAGSGTAAVLPTYVPLAAACPTITIGTDGYPVALCTEIANRAPTVYLLDPTTGTPLASLTLATGSLFGGVYAYLDNLNQLVLVDGTDTLRRIAHIRTALGTWQLSFASSVPLASAFTAACGSPTCDTVVGISPGWDGRVWIATTDGYAGDIDPVTGAAHLILLGAGEHVDNSISTVPGYTAVVTTAALYLLHAGADGVPVVEWRHAYDRGTHRKPGQLSQGSGTTPAFFGPHGDDYLAIVDNAEPHENLLVFKPSSPDPVCTVPVLTQDAVSGTEDAVIASGDSVIVNDTYGYPYPTVPSDAGTAVPATADFVGGLTRVDVGASGCATVWNSTARSAALPRLSTADGLIYTVDSTANVSAYTETYSYAVLDAATGDIVSTTPVGASEAYDMLQLAGTTAAGGVMWQGTIAGVVRIAPVLPQAAATTPPPGVPVGTPAGTPTPRATHATTATSPTRTASKSTGAAVSVGGTLAYTGLAGSLPVAALVLVGAAAGTGVLRRRRCRIVGGRTSAPRSASAATQ